MSMSETERLRKEAARDYRRIAELEAALVYDDAGDHVQTWESRAHALEAELGKCRTDRNEWRLRYERVEELRAMYLTEKKAEAEFNRMSITYVHECARLKIRAEQAEAEAEATHDYAQGELERANEAEAELAALKGRRCWNCGLWSECWIIDTSVSGYGEYRPDDVWCERWSDKGWKP